MAQEMQVKIPLNQLKDRVCKCGNAVFVLGLRIKEVPPIYSPTGQAESAATQHCFLCSACGIEMSLHPEDKEEERKIITFPVREN